MSSPPTTPSAPGTGTPTPGPRARLAVLLSGSGRTLVNLLAAIAAGTLHAEVVLVIASRECLGAQRARDAGLDTRVIPGEIPASTLAAALDETRTDLVVCAGYLKYVHVPPSYAGRIVNIHPALLPRHGGPGMFGDRVHAAVLAAGDSESGCTVHLVDEVYDHGPVLLQRRCPVQPGDTVRSLADRVFEQECVAYPLALQQLIARGVHLSGPRRA